MAKLVRFYDWIFDKEQIDYVSIIPVDESENDNDEQKQVIHIYMKNGKTLSLMCHNLDDARNNLHCLSGDVKAQILAIHRSPFEQYLCEEIVKISNTVNHLKNALDTILTEKLKKKKK